MRKVFQENWSDQENFLTDWRNTLLDYVRGLEEDTVIFTHYVAINAVVGAATGSDAVLNMQPDNGSITIIENDKGTLTLIEKGAENTTKIN